MSENGIASFEELCDFLLARLDCFCENGCVLTDHGLDRFPVTADGDARKIFQKRMDGDAISQSEADAFKSHMLSFLAEEYAKRSLAMQLHIGVLRNNNTRAFETLGADAGFDSPADESYISSLARFLDALDSKGTLPKTVLCPAECARLKTIRFFR